MLKTVHDLYGKKFYILQSDIDSGRVQIPLYHLKTKKRFEVWEHPRGITSIHKSNICLHPIKNFKTVTILGDTWKECAECRTAIEKAVSNIKKEEVSHV